MRRTGRIAWLAALGVLLATASGASFAQEIETPVDIESMPPDEWTPSEETLFPAPALQPVPETRRGGPLFRARSQTDVVEIARAAEANRSGVAIDQVQVVSVTPTEWTDARLGCPSPNPRLRFAQVMVPGFIIVLDVAGVRTTYHTDGGFRVMLCDGPPVQDSAE